MDRKQARFRLLFHKYLQETSSPEELEELFALMREYPDDRFLGELMDEEGEQHSDRKHLVPEEISHSIYLSLNKRLSGRNYIEEERKRKFNRQRYWAVAAVIATVALCTAALYLTLSKSTDWLNVTTTYGEIREVRLPDQSLVTLNGNSGLRYQSDWSNTDRDVYITGEGFFDVVHLQDHQPFRVHTDNEVTIEVLGTSFNVNERRALTEVVLQTGKISLNIGSESEKILMSSGDLVSVNHDSESIFRSKITPYVRTSWKDRKFMFHDTPIEEILVKLRDSYGIDYVVKDTAILNERFTATYPSNKVDVLLKALERSFNIRFDESTKTLTVGEGM